MNDTKATCLACGRSSAAVPIVRLEYLSEEMGICPQHLPILIHDPARLAGRLRGAERMEAAEHDD